MTFFLLFDLSVGLAQIRLQGFYLALHLHQFAPILFFLNPIFTVLAYDFVGHNLIEAQNTGTQELIGRLN